MKELHYYCIDLFTSLYKSHQTASEVGRSYEGRKLPVDWFVKDGISESVLQEHSLEPTGCKEGKTHRLLYNPPLN